jgi:hypothetical protein
VAIIAEWHWQISMEGCTFVVDAYFCNFIQTNVVYGDSAHATKLRKASASTPTMSSPKNDARIRKRTLSANRDMAIETVHSGILTKRGQGKSTLGKKNFKVGAVRRFVTFTHFVLSVPTSLTFGMSALIVAARLLSWTGTPLLARRTVVYWGHGEATFMLRRQHDVGVLRHQLSEVSVLS